MMVSFNSNKGTVQAQYGVMGVDVPITYLYARMVSEYPACQTGKLE